MSQSSGEKTERATPKKRKDARERGQVLKSTEVNTALSMLCMFGVLMALAPFIGNRTQSFFIKYLGPGITLSDEVVFWQDLWRMNIQLVFDVLLILLPIMGSALIIGLIVNYLQVGFLFSTKALAPKFSRLSPAQGFKRIFSTRALVELVKSILKVVILGFIVYDEYTKNLPSLPMLMETTISSAVGRMIDSILMIGIKAGFALLILAAADFLYQWWSYEKELRMSKQEIKDEYKMMEGDPQVKNKIRQKQRQMGMMRMMQAVPEADVVITNPTHYAVALKYVEGEMRAPQVVAKGQNLIAQRIREIARESNVLIIENKPVAQSLFFFCEVGDPIPENMYQAVAEILAVVFRARRPA